MHKIRTMLQIIHTSTRGGAEKHTRLISKAFAQLGVNVTIVFPPGPYAREFHSLAKYGVRCIEYDLKRSIWRTIRFTRKLIREENIDAIHSHMHGADVVAMLAGLGMRKVCLFSTIHFLPQHNPGRMHRLRSSLMTILSFHLANRVFAVSSVVAEQARKAFFLSSRKVRTVLNSIDFDEMLPSEKRVLELKSLYTPKPEDRILLCAGSFVSRKGQQYIIQAIRDIETYGHSVKVLFLGEGEDEQALKDLAYIFGLEGKALFPGYKVNIADWMSIADVYLQVSLVDPLPRAMLEAMYLGVPVVATNLPSMSQVIRDGETGLTVDRRSVLQIARAVDRLLSDEEYAKKIGSQGQAYVASHCSMRNMAESILHSLES